MKYNWKASASKCYSFGGLKPTRPVAYRSEVVGQDVGVDCAWVCQEEDAAMPEMFL